MKTILVALIFAAAVFAFGCISSQQEAGQGQMVGSDTDAHGCIGSAGYVWCNVTQECMCPWEQNCTLSVQEQARRFCNATNVEKVYA